MAELSLRSYIHEIEQQIESGQLDLAIAHCKHILQSHPKCVDIYRLLGNAYLDSQRFTDASDIFQRVISSIPSDFVSHIGMSVIREDEGNLDEAIWHMERAFEVQPSNSMIQDELRRMYGKRDSSTSPRVRLTRGALARLYARGELYAQAIGEIRAALNENPNRLDLEILLAEIYLKTGKKAEATETAQAVLRSLPNCISALNIMIQVLTGADRELELISYRQKLAQLDPYSAYTSTDDPDTGSVPDQAVRLEKLEIVIEQPVQTAGEPNQIIQPGEEFDEASPPAQQDVSEWLNRLVGPATIDNAPEPVGLESDTDIDEVDSQNEISRHEPKAKPELPDWLQALSETNEAGGIDKPLTTGPDDSIPDAALTNEFPPQQEVSLPEWLIGSVVPAATSPFDETPENETEQLASPAEERGLETEVQPIEAEAEMSDEFSEPTTPEDENLPEPAQPAEEIPDWLLELQQEAGSDLGETDTQLDDSLITGTELPDWLLETKPGNESKHELEEDQVPEWLAGAVVDEKPEPKTIPQMEDENEIPDWLRGVEPEEAGSEPASPEAAFPDWKEALETPMPVESAQPAEAGEELPEWLWEEEPIKAEEELPEAEQAIPEWLSSAGVSEGGFSETLESPIDETNEPELFDEQAIPAWLFEDESNPSEPAGETQVPEAEEDFLGDTQPTRIRSEAETVDEELTEEVGFKEDSLIETPLETPATEQDPLEEAFTWLMGLEAASQTSSNAVGALTGSGPEQNELGIEPEAVLEVAEKAEADIAFPEQELEEPNEDDSAFAWLENLAVKQGVEEALLVPPEDRQEEMLDWVMADLPETSAEVAPVELTPVEIEQAPEPDTTVESDDIYAAFDEIPIGEIEPKQAFAEETPVIEGEPLQELFEDAEPLVETQDMIQVDNSLLAPVDQLFEPFQEEAPLELSETPVEETVAAPEEIEPAVRETDAISPELFAARARFANGELRQSLAEYSNLIQNQQDLPLVASDLEEASQRFPDEIEVWQNLGDAYLRLNLVTEALDAYIAAEKLLR